MPRKFLFAGFVHQTLHAHVIICRTFKKCMKNILLPGVSYSAENFASAYV